MIRNRFVLLAFRLAIGGVFIWAGLTKIFDPLGFAQNIEAYKVFPRLIVFLTALTLPGIEVVSGILLVVGLFRRGAALIAAGMLGVFIVLIAVTMVRGLDLSCGCFGSLSGRVGWPLLIQDIVLLLMSLVILSSKTDRLSLEGLRIAGS